jgi:propanol-preferring alcohol dehydrogenase
MRAMQLQKFGSIEDKPLKLVDLSRPKPKDDQVLIKVRVCGVCHTDLHEVEGELPDMKLPIIPGHQVVGEVVSNGPIASRFQKGDRVGVAWLYSTDETCRYCEKEMENLCENAQFTGYHVNGGFAEYIVAPENFVYSLPEAFPDEDAAPLLCAGIVGYRALRLSEVKPGQSLGLIGFGASAHVAIQVAVHWDCDVYVFSRTEAHRRHGEKLGAVWSGTLEENPPKKLDSLINFTPAGSTVLAGMRHLDKGGIQACAGVYMTPIPEMDYKKHLYYEKNLRSVANATRQDGEELIEIAPQIPIRTTTQIFPLEKANEVLKRVKDSKIDGAAVLKIQ